MARPSLPIETQKKIQEMAAAGVSQRAISKAIGLARTSIFGVLFPEKARQQNAKNYLSKKKISARIIALDRQEIPEGWFNIHDRECWLTG